MTAMYATLDDMRRAGKNDNMLRNAYMKYMCWLYYKFERIVNVLGGETLPKILYAGDVSHYELQLLTVLSRAGGGYRPAGVRRRPGISHRGPPVGPVAPVSGPWPGSFPAGFGVKQLQAELEREVRRQRLYGTPPSLSPCTNAWVQKAELNAALTAVQARGNDPRFFCNLFPLPVRCGGTISPSTNDLFAFYQSLQGGGRRICVVNGDPAPPGPEEIAAVKRGTTPPQSSWRRVPRRQHPVSGNVELQRLMTRAFIDLVLEGGAVRRQRLQAHQPGGVPPVLAEPVSEGPFPDWKAPEVAVFLQFGRCASDTGALFLRLLARLPVDVLLLLPHLNEGSALHTPGSAGGPLSPIRLSGPLPGGPEPGPVTTAAYQAERSGPADVPGYGLYRTSSTPRPPRSCCRPCTRSSLILWDQEMKYRPSFSAAGDTVTLPVICQKICGVKRRQRFSSTGWTSRSSSRRTRRWSVSSPGSRARIPTP